QSERTVFDRHFACGRGVRDDIEANQQFARQQVATVKGCSYASIDQLLNSFGGGLEHLSADPDNSLGLNLEPHRRYDSVFRRVIAQTDIRNPADSESMHHDV